MSDRTFKRTEMLLGEEAMEKLAAARVAVFGIGGVGGYVVEGLARSGIGALDLIDSDLVEESNLNRQIIATRDTIGRAKVEAAAERVHSINPNCKVTARQMFFLPEPEEESGVPQKMEDKPGTDSEPEDKIRIGLEAEKNSDDSFDNESEIKTGSNKIDFTKFDYVVDAIDTVTGKLGLIQCAKDAGVPVISAMGAGNKLDPTAFEVADIYETSVCPLARVMRRECKKRGIESLKVVYSKEPPLAPEAGEAPAPGRRATPGSVAFVPSVAGLIIAGEVIKDLIK